MTTHWRRVINWPGLDGATVYTSEYLTDGTVMQIPGGILIGTRPLDVIEAAGREARLMVRRGMADVLVWLGQPVCNEPTGEEILRDLRALADGQPRGKHAAGKHAA